MREKILEKNKLIFVAIILTFLGVPGLTTSTALAAPTPGNLAKFEQALEKLTALQPSPLIF